MNTLPDELKSMPVDLELIGACLSAILADYHKLDKQEIMSSVKKLKNTVDMMEEYAKAYAPVSAEAVKQKIESGAKKYSNDGHASDPYKSADFKAGAEYGYSLTAPVPGKEEVYRELLIEIDKALYIGDDLTDEDILKWYIDVVTTIKDEIKEVLAGASVNSDAVEKTNDEFCICMFRTTSIKGERCGYCLKIVNG